jgi:hypothetical protein
MSKHRAMLRFLLSIPFLYIAIAAAVAQEGTPSGIVSIKTTSVAAGVGAQWGEGRLTFNGKTYPFSLQGLEVAGLGYAEVSAEGQVYNLTDLSDFEGVYAAAEAGVAAGSGPAAVTMRNPNGVVIYVKCSPGRSEARPSSAGH